MLNSSAGFSGSQLLRIRASQIMMKRNNTLLVLGIVLLLGACAGPGRNYVKNEMQETLEVEILPNTSKMFVYRLRWPDEYIPNHVQVATVGSNPEPPKRGGVDVGRSTPERLFEDASYVVQQSGYCREGFFELDRSISRYHLWLKGECKESASEADRKRFGSAKTLNPKQWRGS
jgi:hypothetical protein